jgi:hypothetical protein
VNFTAFDKRFSRICFILRSSAFDVADGGIDAAFKRDAVAPRAFLDERHALSIAIGTLNAATSQLHAAGLDLG